MTVLRVATYNVLRGGLGGSRLHRAVRAMAPDVLVVNEAPKSLGTAAARCRRLAEVWGMRYVAGGRDAGSNMVAVAPWVSVEAATATTLRTPLLRPRRGIVTVQLVVAGHQVGVVGCHLSLDRTRRAREVQHVLAAAEELRGVRVVAGDLNEPPRGESWESLRRAGYVDHGGPNWRTYPAGAPRKRIDAVLVSGTARVVHHGDPGVPQNLLRRASDHRPVLAVLEL